jgi:hypothetical protein
MRKRVKERREREVKRREGRKKREKNPPSW